MSGKSPEKPSKSPFSKSFANVQDIVGEPSSPGLVVAKLSLDALRDILEAVDALPCVKYLAGVGIKILDITDEMQTNKEALRTISIRSGDVVLAVARACEGAQEDMVAALNNDLQQLTGTMNDILSFTSEIAARPAYKRLLYKMEDANVIKALDTQLTHAFQVFVVQSSISLRVSQQQIIQRLADAPTVTRFKLITTAPLHVPEGVYIIRSAVDGRVLEVEHARLQSRRSDLHTYVVPFRENVSPYQLWTIFKRSEGKALEYTIRSFATGAALDVYCERADPGTQVVGHSPHGNTNQLWAFYATRSAIGYDYCTIRSYGPPAVIDTKCPSGNGCELLHASHLQEDGPKTSQEWALIRLPTTTSVPRPAPTPMDIPRREFWLQNVASGRYAAATGLEDKMDDANILLETQGERAGLWHFVLMTEGSVGDAYSEHFAIVTGVAPRLATLDHYAQRCVLASAERFWPSSRHHMWKAIPRNGAFAFENRASKRLLCQSRAMGVVDTAPPTACDNPACLWRLVDPRTGEPCKVLYDATANVVPPEITGLSARSEGTQQTVSSQMLLRTQDAPADVSQRFTENLKTEHELVRGMLEGGHTAIMLGPQLVIGWRNGRISKIYLDDEDSMLGMPKFKGKVDYNPCPS